MSAKDTVRRNKTFLQATLSGDPRLILNKGYEWHLITERDYRNLKSINKGDVEEQMVELVDKIINKGEDSCQGFLTLLQTDEDIMKTYPDLKNNTSLSFKPVRATSPDALLQGRERSAQEEEEEEEDQPYQINSRPAGLCVIINNENFTDGDVRSGTDKDAESLAVVFSWLGFRVLMCKDQTKDQMDRALRCFAFPSDPSELQEFRVQEWLGGGFVSLQEPPKHGDAFICCILSHGERGVVQGVDKTTLAIKQITRTFRATNGSPLKGKPKVFLIQACQGGQMQHGVFLDNLQSDDPSSQFLPQDSDFLLAMATVEDHVAMRHKVEGGWFIQSVCQQLRRRCPSGQDVLNILSHVNNEVSQKEGSRQLGRVKQMPEVRFTLRKRLVLRPHRS